MHYSSPSLILPAQASARQIASTFRAGAARIDITPGEPVSLEGYSDPENRVSEGVHDRLDARALVLESGSKRLVLVSCEVNRSGFGPEASETVIEASVKLLNSVR